MTERRPPTLGTYRPSVEDQPDQRTGATRRPVEAGGLAGPGAAPYGGDGLPRIITSRADASDGRPPSSRPPTKRRRPPPPPPPPEGMSWARIFVFGLLGLLVFVAAAAVAAFVLVPTDLIRSRLEAEVKARTGRDLLIGGRTALTLWPRPAVSVADVTLSAPASMGGGPLIKVAELEVAVQILPLLLHDVAVDRLVLRRPFIDLRVDRQGRRSWDFAAAGAPGLERGPELGPEQGRVRLAQAGAGPGKVLPKELQDFMRGAADSAGAERPRNPSNGKSRISELTLGNVSVVDGTLRYRDERAAIDESFTAVTATVALANIASPLDAKSDFTWRGEQVHLESQMVPFRALLEGRPVQAHIKAVAAPASVAFDGSATFAAEPDLDGRINLSVPAVERLARWTGRSTSGAIAGALALNGRLKQSSGSTVFSDAQVTLGPWAGSGTLAVDSHGARPFIKGALQIAVLDFNALQGFAEAAPVVTTPAVSAPAPTAERSDAPKSIEELLEAAPPQPAGPARKPQVRGYTKRDGWSDDVLDLSALGFADADVRVGFDKIVWQDLTTGPGKASLALKSKVGRLVVDDLQLFGGRARGIATVDATAPEATVGGNVVADGVSTLPFLKALSGFDWLSGRGRVSVAVAGRGATERQIVGTLNGKAEIAIADGAIAGVNIPGIVRALAQLRVPSLERSATEKTDFSELAASTQITNGIARNDDLRIVSTQMRVTGAGTIDLPARTMDYVLKPKIGAAANAAGGFEIPLKITGSMDKPTVTPDLAAFRDPAQAVQAIQEAAKTPAGKEVQETVKGLLNGDPNARAKAKGFLDQLLKK